MEFCSKISPTKPPTKRSAEKLLTEISPIPLTSAMTTLTKRSRNVAVILNGTNNITELKDSDAEVSVHDDSDDEDQSNLDNICVGCGEDYGQTVKSDDWIQCIRCERWLHETCTKYANFCDLCGKCACKI
ncbi:hypothetical protein QE152_g5475 [Popillia japonica]|uniref:Uncharacterized protein n=1 Tax=Popillia japonica TaxID=7064 RepID=A0AAW1MNB8_POPJA